MISYILYFFLTAWLGAQISLNDLRLFTGKYNYHASFFQWLSLLLFIIFVASLTYDMVNIGVIFTLLNMIAIFSIAIVKEWVWSKVNTKSTTFSIIYHLITIFIISICI